MIGFDDSDQFELDLFPGVPWGGRSPRGLTRVGSGLFLRPEPPSHAVYVDAAQLELWPSPVRPPRGKRPRQAAGASLLLPSKKGRRFRTFAKRARSRGDHGDT